MLPGTQHACTLTKWHHQPACPSLPSLSDLYNSPKMCCHAEATRKGLISSILRSAHVSLTPGASGQILKPCLSCPAEARHGAHHAHSPPHLSKQPREPAADTPSPSLPPSQPAPCHCPNPAGHGGLCSSRHSAGELSPCCLAPFPEQEHIRMVRHQLCHVHPKRPSRWSVRQCTLQRTPGTVALSHACCF